MPIQFIRACQDCGHKQVAKDPRTYIDKAGKESWRDTKCRKCGADNLDYGSNRETDPIIAQAEIDAENEAYELEQKAKLGM